jgi:hypothetical protein
MLIVPEKIGWRGDYSGMDTLEKCFNQQYFINYHKKITYQYNSKGFRDHEWPEDLSDVVWCVGDSFTVGIGQPFEETWPQLLEKKTGKRCINVGVDGCSNDTICLRIKEIYKLYKPKLIVVMWSYLHRRRDRKKDIDIHFDKDKKNFNDKADLKNFEKNLKNISNLSTNIIHTAIPGAIMDNEAPERVWNRLSKIRIYKKKLILFKQLDYARDYQHFDIKTSEHIVNLISKNIDNISK